MSSLDQLLAEGRRLRDRGLKTSEPEPAKRTSIRSEQAPRRGQASPSLQPTWIDPEEVDFTPAPRPGNPLAARFFSYFVTVLFLALLAWLIVPELQFRIVHRNSVEVTNGVLSAQPVPLSPVRPAIVLELYVDAGDLPDGVLPAGTPIASLESANRDNSGTERTTLVAPFDARFASVDTLVGSVTQPGTPVVTLYDPSKMYVIATVNHESLELLRRDMEVELSSDILSSTISGTVVSAVPLLGSDLEPSQSQYVNIRIKPDPEAVADLVPGIHFDASIDLASAPPGAQPLVITNVSHDGG